MTWERRAGDAVHALAVVVPVHDEEALLPRCLAALEHAVAEVTAGRSATGAQVDGDSGGDPGPGLAVHVVLVLDDCSDGSAQIAAASPFTTLAVAARSVGLARAHGVEAVLDALGLAGAEGDDLAGTWIASTDADSAVPAGWLTEQLRLATSGTDLMIGTVRPDRADLSDAQWAAWSGRYTPGRPNGHVHGANLGIRADVYRRAGGYAPLAEHEDVDLVARARAAGARVTASDDCSVLTSGRPVGRTPGGYARYLREDLVPQATRSLPVA